MFAQPANVRRASPLTGQLTPGLFPTGGINSRDAWSVMPPSDAVDLINVVTSALGLISRGGYQWWAWNLPNNRSVPTIMSYYPAQAGSSGIALNRASQHGILPSAVALNNVVLRGQLFACTNNNIYDVTAGGPGPWTAQPGLGVFTSDYWTWRNFQNAAGNFLLACNNDGGYVAFGAAGFSSGFSDGFRTLASGFTRIVQGIDPGTIQGINPDQFCYVMVWKQRLWFIEKDSSRAWYLPTQQLTGQATQFDFGPHFRHGGHLAALVNWTLDGGEGIDDYLVAVGSEGDVVIFKGYDPDAAADDPNAFQLHGIWYVGALPDGFRSVDPYGGDVYILSLAGITALSMLVNDKSGVDSMGQISDKIDPLITALLRTSNRDSNWYLKLIPAQEYVIVGIPQIVTRAGVGQLAYTVKQRAWHRFADLPLAHFTTHDALTFAGGDVSRDIEAGGKVFLAFENAVDNVAPITEVATPRTIKCRIIPAYGGFGAPGLWKTYPMVRPSFLANQVPNLRLQVLTDYALPSVYSQPTIPANPQFLWDSALWNSAKWSGNPPSIRKWLATKGGGYAATVQMDFEAAGSVSVTNIDWWTKGGGPL